MKCKYNKCDGIIEKCPDCLLDFGIEQGKLQAQKEALANIGTNSFIVGYQEAQKDILEILRMKCNIRMRGLECDIRNQENKDYYTGALNAYDVLFRHLEKIDWIIADIECGSKYLDDKEKKQFEELKQKIQALNKQEETK